MRLPSAFLAITLLSFLIGCREQKAPSPPQGPITSCAQMPTLQWQKASTGMSVEDILKVSASLNATAKAEIDKAKQASGEAKLSADLSNALKKEFNASSDVSQDFWQQDIIMMQQACFMSAESKRIDLTPEQKAAFLTQEVQWSENAQAFVAEKKGLQPSNEG